MDGHISTSKAFTKDMNMFFRKLLFSTAVINATAGCVSYQAQQAAVNTVNTTGVVLNNVVKTTIAQPCNVAVTVAKEQQNIKNGDLIGRHFFFSPLKRK